MLCPLRLKGKQGVLNDEWLNVEEMRKKHDI
jgi:hypothetical protein